MTSPLDAWNQLFRIDEAYLAGDDAQLEVICCEAAERTVSHIGIEYGNCTYNSDVVRQLLRKYGRDGKLTLEVRANNLAAQIWVRDPGTGSWIEVRNSDPQTCDLTFAQVSMIERLRRMDSTPERKITRAEGRRRMLELVERAQAAKTIRSLPRLLALLGVEDAADRSAITDRHLKRIGAPARPAKKAPPRTQGQTNADPSSEEPPTGRKRPQSGSVPVYEVVMADSNRAR